MGLKPSSALGAMALAACLSAPAFAAPTAPSNFVIENAVPNVTFSTPTGIAFLPDGRYFVAEKRGVVWLVENGVRRSTAVWSRENEVLNTGDRGLLGIAVDPNWYQNHYLYLLYTVDPDSNGTDDNDDAFGRLTRYTMSSSDSNVVSSSSRTILFGASWGSGSPSGSQSHTIGSLRFGADGSLIVSTGDGASFSATDDGGLDPNMFTSGRTSTSEDIGAFRAQYLSSLAGKILRINPSNGSGYTSNPFYDGNLKSVASRVYARGFRNPFRFCVRPGTGSTDSNAGNPGTLYIGEVGWNTWEEANVVTAGGQDFGWPCYEGVNANTAYQGASPSHDGCGTVGTVRGPLMTWNHNSSGSSGSIPSGLVGNASIGGAFYTKARYPTGYRGYFLGDYGADWIKVALVTSGNALSQLVSFSTGAEGPVDFATDPISGDVFYVSIRSGQVRRIRYTGTVPNTPPVAAAIGVPSVGAAPLTVAFSSAGTSDVDGDPLTYNWTFGDGGASSSANPSHVYSTIGTYTATLTVNDGRGGTATAQVSISVGSTANFPSTSVLDAFNRANGALGGSWVGATSGLSILTNQLKPTSGDVSVVWNGGTFGADQEAYLTLSTISASATESDLMLKVQGQSWDTGHIEVRYDAVAKRILVSTYAPSQGWQGRGNISVTLANGDQLGARASSNGQVTVYRNGVSIGLVSVTGWPYVTNGGRLGLSIVGATASAYDNFGGGNVTATPPPTNTPPVASITSPANNSFYVPGIGVSLVGTGTDGQDAASALTGRWELDLHHNNHVHGNYFSAATKSATYVPDNHEDGTGTWLEGRFILTDTGGLSDTAGVNLYPEVDLDPSAVVTTPTSPVNPGTTQYRFYLRNSGRQIAPYTRWVIRANSTLVAQGDTLVPALDSVLVSRTVTTLGAGTYALRVTADSLAAIRETNESNNAKTGTLVVTGGSAPPTFPLTAVLDGFNRADGAPGSPWAGNLIGLAIVSNQLDVGSTPCQPVWNGATFGADQEAYVTLSTLTTTAPEHNLMLKVQGTSWSGGHIEIRYDHVVKRIVVSTYSPTAGWQGRATISVTLANGDQLGARASADGTVRVYRNGTQIGGPYSLSGWTWATSGGRIGLSLADAGSTRLDDFGGGNVPAGSAPALASQPSSTGGDVASLAAPTAFALSNPFPNPTRGGMAMWLDLPRAADVSVAVLDLQGRRLWGGAPQSYGAGRWSLEWPGHADDGRPLPAGLYLVRVTAGAEAWMRRLALIH